MSTYHAMCAELVDALENARRKLLSCWSTAPHPTPHTMSNPYRNALAELHAAIQLITGPNPAPADVCPAELVRRLKGAMAASAALLAQSELERQ